MKLQIILGAAALLTAASFFSTNAFAEQRVIRGDESVKTLVELYENAVSEDTEEAWELFDDEYSINGGRRTWFFNDELSDIKSSSDRLIKVFFTQNGEPTENTSDFFEQGKNFSFCFYTGEGKEYYFDFDITTRTVFSIRDVIKGSGVPAEQIAVAMLLGDAYNSPYEIIGVSVSDCVKGWNTLDDSKYYVKKNGTLSTGLCKVDGVMYRFGGDAVCRGKYTGFAKVSEGRKFYNKGKLLKSCRFIYCGKTYKADKNGYVKQ